MYENKIIKLMSLISLKCLKWNSTKGKVGANGSKLINKCSNMR